MNQLQWHEDAHGIHRLLEEGTNKIWGMVIPHENFFEWRATTDNGESWDASAQTTLELAKDAALRAVRSMDGEEAP